MDSMGDRYKPAPAANLLDLRNPVGSNCESWVGYLVEVVSWHESSVPSAPTPSLLTPGRASGHGELFSGCGQVDGRSSGEEERDDSRRKQVSAGLRGGAEEDQTPRGFPTPLVQHPGDWFRAVWSSLIAQSVSHQYSGLVDASFHR